LTHDEGMLSELLFELEHRDPEISRVLREVQRSLLGFGSTIAGELRPESSLQRAELARDLRIAVRSGRLKIADVDAQRTGPSRRRRPSVAPSLGPQAPQSSTQRGAFEVTFLDEAGQAINGIDIVFTALGLSDKQTTDDSGKVRFDSVASFATVSVASVEAVRQVLEPRWDLFRVPKLPIGSGVTQRTFSQDLESVTIESNRAHLVVIKPKLGQIHSRLFDKTGRVVLAHTDYRIAGPVSFADKTDENGELLHEQVPPGDYSISLDVTGQPHSAPLVVLESTDDVAQVRMLGAVPRAVFVRMRGIFFETNKAFLLPTALPQLRKIRSVYLANDPSDLLIVGHTDTTAQLEYNDKLSVERADSVAAFLSDDVDAWLEFYSASKSREKRWGGAEDRAMIRVMPDFADKPPTENPIVWYQRTRGLTIDGNAGNETRRALVTEYMRLDGASLKELGLSIRTTTHGCGENFPLDDSAVDVDSSPLDGSEEAPDRRVELFFFDAEFGIQPPPPGKNSTAGSPQYRAWRDQAELLLDLDAPGPELPAVCQIALTLEQFDGTPLSNAVFQLTTPDGLITNKTDPNGNLTVPDLPPDDYLLQVGELNQFVSAIANGEARRTIRFAATSVVA
jgi:outer membrane protein OmpA-like peptidoglycan-associated protein